MMTKKDMEWIAETSKEIIEATGELIDRWRLVTAVPPDSYDADFGEVVKEGEEQYSIIQFIGKVFWDVSEEILQEIFGAGKITAAIVHIPFAVDVRAKDILIIRGMKYDVVELK